MAINVIEINQTNEYLASCSNDGLVLVWEIVTGRPITALKESVDDPVLVLIFYKGQHEEYLIVASEKGNVYVYKVSDIIKC
jgi:bromodomain and WD repeat domain-containing protein 1/3